MKTLNKILKYIMVTIIITLIYTIASILVFFVALWDWDRAKREIKELKYSKDIKDLYHELST